MQKISRLLIGGMFLLDYLVVFGNDFLHFWDIIQEYGMIAFT